jgi:predicted nucleic acid-binding protein
MKLYLDMCALKRPFDDQSQERIADETQAITLILDRVEKGLDKLIWSSVLTLENDADPDHEARSEVAEYAAAAEQCLLTPIIDARLRDLTAKGIRPLDAAHIAFGESSSDVLITCDDRLIRQAARTGCLIKVLNPIEYLREIGHGF